MESKKKNIIVLINHAPCGSIHFTEGLRAAMGLVASTDELNVTVVFMGEGVYAALSGFHRGEVSRYIATMSEWESGLTAEKESLAEHGIRADELAPDVEVISRSQVLHLLHSADFTIDF